MSTRCWREICCTKLFFSRAYPVTSLQGAYVNHILLLPVAGFFLSTGAAFWIVCGNVRSQATQFNSADLWHLRHGLQFWQLRTWIQDNLCYLKEWQWTAVAILVYIVDFHSACSRPGHERADENLDLSSKKKAFGSGLNSLVIDISSLFSVYVLWTHKLFSLLSPP